MASLPVVSETINRMPQAQIVSEAQAQFRDAVTAAWSGHQAVPMDAVLVHGCGGPWPSSAVKGEVEFGMQVVTVKARTNHLTFSQVPIPEKSSELVIVGSGKGSFANRMEFWRPVVKSDPRSSTSRAVFSAFCDALDSGRDRNTGGPPQLVGVYANGKAHSFGTWWKGRAYLSGSPDLSQSEQTFYFDRYLQRVDSAGVLISGAQRHASRPT